MKDILRVEGLSFAYDGRRKVLENVSFKVQEGEFVGIIGPNGAGKTTLLRLILKLLKGFEGKIYLFGTELERFKEWERVGYVPQRVGLNKLSPVSVRELLLSSSRNREVLNSLVEFLHMEELMDKQFKKLSGGQQQLVLLGMALSSEPELIFLDEPTAGLDIHSREHLMEILKELSSKRGKTIIMVSHNLGMLFSNVDRVIAIDCEVKYDGSPENSRDILASLFGLHGED